MQSEPITYSSYINLTLSAFPNISLYSDGFTQQTFSLRSFHQLEGNLFHDYSNCVFRIYPSMNYKAHDMLIDELVQEDFAKLESEQNLKRRKQLIQTLLLNLENELTSNISLSDKLKGTPLVYSSSIFHLVHVQSMRFLAIEAIDDENLEDLQFKLVDFPNESSLLKFHPCLQFQKLRTNVVYHGDVVGLSATKQYCNRMPNLYTTYWGSFYYKLKDEPQRYIEEVESALVQASLEESTQWRINIFQQTREGEDIVYVDDIIVLNLPEQNRIMNVKRSKDLFENIQQILEGSDTLPNQQIDMNKSQMVKQPTGNFLNVFIPQQTIGITYSKQNSEDVRDVRDKLPDSVLQKSESSQSKSLQVINRSFLKVSKDVQEIKKILNQDINVIFDDIQINNENTQIPYSAYWRIEQENQTGGQVLYDKLYRIRHFQTGKYLEISNQKQIQLTSQVTKNTLFYLIPIKKSSKYITKDSYFHLKHLMSGSYIDHVEQNLVTVQIQKSSNVFKIRKADYENLWETRFLLYCVPLLTEAITFFEQLPKHQIKIDDLKVDDIKEMIQFYNLQQRLSSMLTTINSFVHNKLISNIERAQDFSFVSKNRQNIIREESVMPLLLWLMIKSFPQVWERIHASKESIITDLSGERSQIFRIEAVIGHQKVPEKFIKLLEENHRKRKHLLSLQIMETVEAICWNNPKNQERLFKFFPHLEKNLSQFYVTNALVNSLSKNYQILSSLTKNQRLQQITLQFTYIDQYSSPELLQLLASSCQADYRPVFANQEYIMNIIKEKDQKIARKMLMNFSKTQIEDGQYELQINAKNIDGINTQQSLRQFLQQRNQHNPNFLPQYNYIIQQLNLYASLCFHRNVLAKKNFQSLFPYKLLKDYALDDQVDDVIRAQICRLIKNMYIDTEPNTTIPKPELVRILDPIPVTQSLFFFKVRSHQKDDLQDVDIIELKTSLLHYLENKYNYLKQYDDISQVYNQLTLEIIKILELILRFELFWQKDAQTNLQSTRKKGKRTGINNLFMDRGPTLQSMSGPSDINRLVTYLAFFLEYDKKYFECLKESQVNRAYQADGSKTMMSMSRGFLNVATNISNVFSQKSEKVEEKQPIKSIKIKIQDSEIINDPLFKKLKSLRKVLIKYTNKTFTARENKENDFETLIKIQICQVFSYLMDVSQDFLIDNALACYKKGQQPDYQKLFPDDSLCCGDQFQVNTQKQYYIDAPYLRSFDEILQRPFIEILLLSLYFTRNPQLENYLVDIIQRFSRQKKEFLLHFQNVEILDQTEQQQLHNVWVMLIAKLKNQIQYSQSWISQECKQMNKVYDNLWKVDSIFQQSQQVSLKLKQKIFEHIGGYQVFIELIDKSLSVIDNGQETQKLIHILRIVMAIMSYFSKDNEENSLKVFKKVVKQIIHYPDYNLGQVTLINSLFESKPTLFGYLTNDEYSSPVILITKHGKYPEFLIFYDHILEVAENFSKNSDMHKEVLSQLTNPEFSDQLNPFQQNQESRFYEYPPNTEKYKTKFLKLVSQCLQRDVGVSLIIQTANMLKLVDLLQYSQNVTTLVFNSILQREQPDSQQLKIKKYLWELIKLLFDNMKGSIDQLSRNHLTFFSILDMEYNGITLQEHFISSQLDYFFDSLLPIINSYNEALQNSLNNTYVQQDKMYTFVQFFLKNLKKMFFLSPQDLLGNKRRMKTINELGHSFNIKLHKQLTEFEDRLAEIQLEEQIPIVQPILQYSHSGETSSNLQKFRQEFLNQEEVVDKVKVEASYLSKSIWNIDKMFKLDQAESKDLLLNNEDIIVKILGYLQFWRNNGASKENIVFILKVLTSILKDAEQKEGDEEEQVELLYRQNLFDSMNVTQIILVLLYESEMDPVYLSTLMKFLILLLKNGNQQVQKTAYDFFLSSTACEKLFKQFANIMDMQIQSQNRAHKLNNQENKLVCKTLKIIQLFCEGHNQDLQNYLRDQYNQKNTIDLVTLTVQLLNSFQISKQNQESVLQCFETLTELIQGPCKQNQITLTKSNFLEYAVKVLDEDEKIFDHSGQYERPGMTYNFSIHPGTLAQIKFKCLNTIVSLLECNETSDSLMTRIIRTIPLTVLINNLTRINQLFDKYEQNQYTIDVFKRAEEEFDPEKPDKPNDYYELILENGFNIFVLMQLFLSNRKAKELLYEDSEMSEVLNEFFNEDKDDSDGLQALFNGKLFGEIANLGGNLINKIKDQIKSDEQIKQEQLLLEKQKQKAATKNAIKFFRTNTCNIDFLRDNKLYTVYFPRLPICNLPKYAKIDFHDTVDRTSSKTKLAYLMEQAKEMIRIMKNEEKLNRLFAISPIFGFFATHGKLWEQLAFATTLIINFIICMSYSQYFLVDGGDLLSERLNDPRFFTQAEFTWTPIMIRILGIIMLIFSSLIVFFFVVKRAPLKVDHLWAGFLSEKGFFNILISFLKRTINSMFILLRDVDVLYYSIFIIAGVVGLAVHPFFFAFHLMDVLRLEQLKTVVQAIWYPRVELGLSILMMAIIEYYFGILAYTVYHEDLPFINQPIGERGCATLWRCVILTFDLTFKYTGSIGAGIKDYDTVLEIADETYLYVQDIVQRQIKASSSYNGTDHRFVVNYIAKFIYDNVVNILMVFIMMNMMMGITIDTFRQLRQQLQERIKDKTFKCFICGITRDKFEKNDSLGFSSHIKQEHYMWNYIYYIAYLNHKDENDYNGNESYISNKVKGDDISWLPIKRARFIEEEANEDLEITEDLENVQAQFKDINENLEKTYNRVNHVIELSKIK